MKFFYFIFLCILSVSCQVRKDYKITGNVQGIPDSSVIDLYVLHEYSGTRVASDTILNGKFSFSDSIGDEILNMVLSMRDDQKYFGSCNLWVGKANIGVNGSGRNLSAWKVSSDVKEQSAENKLLGQTGRYKVQIDSLYFLKAQIQQSNKDGKRLIQSKIDSISKISRVKELEHLKNNYNSLIALFICVNLPDLATRYRKPK